MERWLVSTTYSIGFVHHPKFIDPPFVACLINLLVSNQRPDQVISFPCGPAIDVGRNALCRATLATTSENLLMVDTDMTFSPEDVEAIKTAPPDTVVSGLAFTHDYRGTLPALYRHVAGQAERLTEYPHDDLFEVDYSGAAFLWIPRSALEKVEKDWFSYAPSLGSAEDVAFGARLKKRGIRLMCDSRIKIGHLKNTSIGEWTVQAQQAATISS